jgi:hypothetical protein
MRGFALLAFAVVCLALSATAQAGPKAGPHEIREIGIVHKEIAESSPVASGTLQAVKNPVKAGEGIRVHFTLQNRSDHDIQFGDALVPVLDVRDENGDLAPETAIGRDIHFFSPHHTEKRPPFLTAREGIIHAHGKEEGDCYPIAEYVLTPGTYTVVGYVCSVKEGPECFKTNTITITVEQRQSAGE